MGVYLSEAFVTQAVFRDHCLITIITTHKAKTRMLCITSSVPGFAAAGQRDAEQGPHSPSSESLTHPREELVVLLLLPQEE